METEVEEPSATPEFQRSNRPLRALAAVENALMFALLAGTVLTLLAQVFFRYALEKPLSWSNEAATDLLVYVAFVGFAIGIRDNAHVALNLFERRLGVASRRWLRIGELAVLGVVLSCIGIGGAEYLWEQRDVVSPVGIPLWAAFVPLPLGAALGMVHIVVEVVALLRGASVPGHVDPEAEPDDGPDHDADHDAGPKDTAFQGGAV
jgi:TRAP-type C4-dicarboxylate transport system permease small subunit